MAEQLDEEMLKHLDLLLDMDVVESEADWETVEELEQVKDKSPEEVGESHE